MNNALLTVIGKDRPGIIAGVTEILFKRGCNLEDISMTILEGEFAMMVIVNTKTHKKEAIQKDFSQRLAKWGLTLFWKDLKRKLKRGEKHSRGSETYLISAMGRDRHGIVYESSRLLFRFGLNVTDLNSKILGHGNRSVYVMLLEVDIPRRFQIQKLKRSLRNLSRKMGIEIKIRPVERVEL